MYSDLDDRTPPVPAPAHGSAEARTGASAAGTRSGGLLQRRALLSTSICAHHRLQKGNASVREMYLNIDAVAMHEPGALDCASCSCRPGLFITPC